LGLRIVFSEDVEQANEAHALGLLGFGHNRPSRRTTKNAQKFPPPHERFPREGIVRPHTNTLKGAWIAATSALPRKRT
jgi:hypothetical protein